MINEIALINKSNVKLRITYDIINDILFCCCERWITRTNIYSYIGLMKHKRYLINFLVNKELIDERIHPTYNDKKQYKISGKGLRFCKLYSEMVGLIQ